jgi:hypothetical protein
MAVEVLTRQERLGSADFASDRGIDLRDELFKIARSVSPAYFIENRINSSSKEEAVAYDPRFDQDRTLPGSLIARQVDTFLGERLNVLLSTSFYEIEDGIIYGEDMEDPFIEVIRKGVRYREGIGGENRVDRKREEAEVKGFLKVQEELSDPNTEIGTMMLSVSASGGKNSIYQHNFYDIFTVKEYEKKRVIEARRYSSALSNEEYKEKLQPFYYIDELADDVYFLSHPMKIDSVFFDNPDEIHGYLHKDHEFINVREFERIIAVCDDLKNEYIRTREPYILNAIMNKADHAAGLINLDVFSLDRYILGTDPRSQIDFYGGMKVRQAATGCGSSGSVSNPFSVSEFSNLTNDRGYDFDKTGTCVKCESGPKALGPCGICEECVVEIEKEDELKEMFAWPTLEPQVQRFSLN